eukprot:764802-Hanusia_phi.AAC.4
MSVSYIDAALARPVASSTSSLQHDRHSLTRSVSLILSSSLSTPSANHLFLLLPAPPPAAHLEHLEHTRVSVKPNSRQLEFLSDKTPLVARSRASEAMDIACWRTESEERGIMIHVTVES